MIRHILILLESLGVLGMAAAFALAVVLVGHLLSVSIIETPRSRCHLSPFPLVCRVLTTAPETAAATEGP